MNFSDMESKDWITWGLAVLAIAVGVWAVRRWGNRRRKVVFEWSASPLIPAAQGDATSGLAVTYRDFEVKDPYLLTLRLINVGPADVASSHFDGDRDLIIDLGCKMYGLLRPPSGDGTLTTTTTAVGSQGVISVGPGLLRRGSEWTVEVVVGGEPSPVLTNPLIDTDVVDPPTYRRQLAGHLLLRVAKGVLRTAGVSAVAFTIPPVELPRRTGLGNG